MVHKELGLRDTGEVKHSGTALRQATPAGLPRRVGHRGGAPHLHARPQAPSIVAVSEHRVLAPTPPEGGKLSGPASYFPSIEKTYGRPIQEWLDLVAERVVSQRHTEVVQWLKTEHGMGHGHANAVVAYVRAAL